MIQHTFKNGTCINCGFCREVIEHFDWPCRLDYRTAAADDPFQQSSHRPGQEHRHGDQTSEPQYQAWRYRPDEARYGRLLGLTGKVTKGDIKSAYREQASLYHPDKVAHLARDIQEFATEKMKEINLAFAYFQHKYGVE